MAHMVKHLPTMQETRGSIPGSGRSPGEGNDNPPIPVLLPGKSYGQRSLVGYNPQGCKELDMTERLHLLTYMQYKYYFDLEHEVYISK